MILLQSSVWQNALVIFCKVGRSSREGSFLPQTQFAGWGKLVPMRFHVRVCGRARSSECTESLKSRVCSRSGVFHHIPWTVANTTSFRDDPPTPLIPWVLRSPCFYFIMVFMKSRDLGIHTEVITMEYLRITVVNSNLCYEQVHHSNSVLRIFQDKRKGNTDLHCPVCILWKAGTALSRYDVRVAFSSSQSLWCYTGLSLMVLIFVHLFLGQQSSLHSHHTDPNEVTEVPRGSSSCGCENLANYHWHRWKGDFSRGIEGARTFTPRDFLGSHTKGVYTALPLQPIPPAKTEAKLNIHSAWVTKGLDTATSRSREADHSVPELWRQNVTCCYSWHRQTVVRCLCQMWP